MITKKQLKYIIQLLSLLATFAYALFLFLLWYLAFFSGSEAVLLTINSFGEMWLEFVAWPVVIPIIVYGFWLNIRQIFLKE